MVTAPNRLARGAPPLSSLAVGIVAAAGALGAAVAAGDYALALDVAFWGRAFAAYAAGALCVAVLVLKARLAQTFGPANAVTLVRMALLAPLVAMLVERPGGGLAWFAVALAIVGLVLDGMDGALARRTGYATRFGARFDMETDAALILVLSALCWAFDKAGAWILAAGAMRYAFAAAGMLVPWLACPLPASRRRQTVCVLQIVALLACLSPLFAPPWSGVAGAVGLTVLAWSFLVDVRWLARRA